MSKIEIDTDKIQPLINMLYLSNKPKVYRLANYIKKDDNRASFENTFGNTCQDYQNYMYETFGIWLHDNRLSENNKKSVNDFIDKLNKGNKADE